MVVASASTRLGARVACSKYDHNKICVRELEERRRTSRKSFARASGQDRKRERERERERDRCLRSLSLKPLHAIYGRNAVISARQYYPQNGSKGTKSTQAYNMYHGLDAAGRRSVAVAFLSVLKLRVW